MAALLRACDKGREFEYLAVETARSIQRMHRFLAQNKLDPKTTTLPFIVLVTEGEGETQRAVLQGESLQRWLTSLLDAFLVEPGTNPEMVLSTVLRPNLGSHVLRLMEYAMVRTTTAVVVTLPPQPPPNATATTGLPEAYLEELDDTNGAAEEVDMEEDEFAHTTISSVPIRNSKSRAAHTVNISSVLNDSKERETMVQRKQPNR